MCMICLPGLGVVRLAERATAKRFRAWHLVWVAGAAASCPILYIAGRIFPFSGPTALAACIGAGLAMLGLSRLLTGRAQLGAGRRLHWPALLLVLAVCLTLATAYVEFDTGSDVYANAVRDWNPRQAMIWSIRHYGLPLQDSLFYPGRPLPMYYTVGSYLAVAAAADLGGPGVPDAWPYAIFTTVTFLGFCLVVGDLAGRIFASRRAASWAAVLVLAGGMDVVINAALAISGKPVSLGHAGAWANPHELRIDGLYACALWAPPHLAAIAAVPLLVRWMPFDLVRRPGGCIAAGFVLAGMFYMSPYVTVAALAVVAANLVLQVPRRRWRRWARQILSLACCGMLAAAMVATWLVDLRAADLSGGRAKLTTGLPKPSIHPISLLTGAAAGQWPDLAVQVLLELSPMIVLGLLGWRLCKVRRRWQFHANALALSIPVILVLALAVRSTGEINDWGVRVTHVLQVSLAVLAGGLMAGRKGWSLLKRIAVYAFILIGFGASAWHMGSANLGRFVVTTPPRRLPLYRAARYIDRAAAPDAVIMFDLEIKGINYARRWSNRRALLANADHGSMVYTDQAAMRQVRAACRSACEEGFSAGSIDALRRFGASVALVRVESLSPALRNDRILYENGSFAVVDLSRPAGK